jgi:hypothetical protein
VPNLVASLEGTIARAGSQLGQWWPNVWAPHGNPTWNDCAMFVSWVLWGLPANGAPYQTVVSGLIERSGLEFHAGHSGIRRGDVIGFRWNRVDNYDHTEIALSSPNASGFFQTIGANGGGNDKVAIHTRSTIDVHNYARPNYPATGTASSGSTPIPTPTHRGVSMIVLIPDNDDNKWYAQSPLTGLAVPVADADVAIMLRYMEWVHGTADDQTNRWNAAAFVTVQKYIRLVNPPSAGGGTVDLTAINAAVAELQKEIEALDKQGDDYEAALLALMNKGLTITGTATPAK